MILQSIEFAVESLNSLIDSGSSEITHDFAKAANEIIENIPASAFIISKATTERGIKLIEYFNINKLILCSYQIEPDSTFEQAFVRIYEQRPQQLLLSTRFSSYNSKIIKYMRKVFSIEQSRINSSILANGNLSVAEVNEVFKNLENLQLGYQEIETANNSHKVNWFYRVSAHQVIENPEIGQVLIDLGLNLKQVIKTLEDTELKYSVSDAMRNKSTKRKDRSNTDCDDIPTHNLSKKPRTEKNLTALKIRADNQLPYLVPVEKLSKPTTSKQAHQSKQSATNFQTQNTSSEEPFVTTNLEISDPNFISNEKNNQQESFNESLLSCSNEDNAFSQINRILLQKESNINSNSKQETSLKNSYVFEKENTERNIFPIPIATSSQYVPKNNVFFSNKTNSIPQRHLSETKIVTTNTNKQSSVHNSLNINQTRKLPLRFFSEPRKIHKDFQLLSTNGKPVNRHLHYEEDNVTNDTQLTNSSNQSTNSSNQSTNSSNQLTNSSNQLTNSSNQSTISNHQSEAQLATYGYTKNGLPKKKPGAKKKSTEVSDTKLTQPSTHIMQRRSSREDDNFVHITESQDSTSRRKKETNLTQSLKPRLSSENYTQLTNNNINGPKASHHL